jgi:hypothetical protein
MQKGETPSVLSMSWGTGDFHKDEITVVFLDQEGRLRDNTTIGNLTDPEPVEELLELIQRRKPEVVVIGGFTISTSKLYKNMHAFLRGSTPNPDLGADLGTALAPQYSHTAINIPVIYVHDEVARLFQHSKRAELELGSLTTLAKYCVGLARFTQSPLNEYAALGEDITAITFDEESQNLVSRSSRMRMCSHSAAGSKGEAAHRAGTRDCGNDQRRGSRHQPRCHGRLLSTSSSVRLRPRSSEGPAAHKECREHRAFLHGCPGYHSLTRRLGWHSDQP